MASPVSIKIKSDAALARVVKALGPSVVLPPHKRNLPHAVEFRQMELLEAVADALEANDPPGAPTAVLPTDTTTPNTAGETAAEKELVTA